MTTQNFGIRGAGPAVAAGLALTIATFVARAAHQRRQTALTEQHRLHFDLLCKAMDDPALTVVLDTYDEAVPLEKQRQFLFANALYINAVHALRIGAMTIEELYGHLRIMCQNEVFREYWEATRHHRASLHDSSMEAQVGRMTDHLARDLAEADTEEWWVVGKPSAHQ
ncbi:DUF6082 family protein [Streptomyces longispororuber]|uniref:DUF6082 family protein n=1 Tax=Streptomyces longispororuber TaxID=68230 RepID=UPI0033FBA7CB